MRKAEFLKKTILSALTGMVVIPGSAMKVRAEDTASLPIAGIESVLAECYLAGAEPSIEADYLVSGENKEYSDKVFANVTDFAYIRKEPKMTSEWVGKLYSNGMAEIKGISGDWIYIQSGNVTGYVQTEQLYIGKEAQKFAAGTTGRSATVTAYALNVRKGRGTGAEILTCISQNEQYSISGEAVDGWYPIEVRGEAGWVNGNYIYIEDTFSTAESKEEEEQRLAEEKRRKEEEEAQIAAKEAAAQETAERLQVTTEQAANGQAVIDYACQFIGNPYVWGGTSLTNGADCSGFVQAVYLHFGISLPRTSREMRNAGYAVSYENAMPGDIICYEGHVGLYMGNGTIVNAIDQAHGIGISNATYTSIITIRRMF